MRRIGFLLLLSFVGLQSSQATQNREDFNHFTHGPILGRLSAHGVGVWARTARTGSFSVRYGTSPQQLLQNSQPVATVLEHDNTGWVQLSGLQADTKYFYELEIPGVPGPSGRKGSFRTLPDSAEMMDPELNPKGLFNFSFEFACGNNQNPGQGSGPALPAFQTMLRRLKDQIYFAILNGDWLYETQREYKPAQWLRQVEVERVPRLLEIAPTLAGVWENYKHYLTQAPALARWHSEIPSFFTYDDHEILNDVWGAGTPGLRDRRAAFRDIGVQGWYDYLGWSNPTTFQQPIHFGRVQVQRGSDILTDPQADFTRLDLSQAINLHMHWGTDTAGVNDNSLDGVGGDPNAGVYRIVRVVDGRRLQIEPPVRADGTVSYSIGRRSYYRMRLANCDFFLLDTRGQREMHDVNDPFKKVSMLGKEQLEWLMEGIRSSTADFIFVVSSVNFMVPHVGGGAVRAENKDDAWTVFYDERERLIDFWDSVNKPVLLLSGDLHNSFVIQITDNVWEFASGPHNSNNHWVSDEGDRPATGAFKYGPREVNIRWSTYFRTDIPRANLLHPTYCVVQINNVFNNPKEPNQTRWVAFEKPQVVFQYFDGRSGQLRYAEALVAQ